MIKEIGDFFRAFGRPCSHQTMLASRDLTEPLTGGEWLGHRAHLLICKACKQFTVQIRYLRAAAVALGRTQRAPQLSSESGMPEGARVRLAAKAKNLRDSQQML